MFKLSKETTAFETHNWLYKLGFRETAFMFNKFGLCLSNRRDLI